MAIYYLSKAVKYLEKSNEKTLASVPSNNPNAKVNPNENINNLSS